ncbi:MAG: hypothetical protein ACI4VH_03565 [Clostridia bacterium]
MMDIPNKEIENILETEETNTNTTQNDVESIATFCATDELLQETDSIQSPLEDNKNSDISKQEPIERNENEETVNCLALTVQKDYNLCIVKNVILKTLKTTWKIAISVITLNFLKFFL